jgi:hypothetical protein
MKTISEKSAILFNYLKEQGFMNDQEEFTNDWNPDTFEQVCAKFDEGVRNNLNFNTPSNYYKVLNPLAFKTAIFEPENLTGDGRTYYSKGNWYIPSKEELELLIWYRVRSTTIDTTPNTESYWNSVAYSNGSSIFSDKSSYFESFLGGKMIAANVSTSNKNFAYGEVTYYAQTSLTKYGWFYNYTPN